MKKKPKVKNMEYKCIEGFTPLFVETSHTYDPRYCVYCHRKMFHYKNRKYYVLNKNPICEDCLIRFCAKYNLSPVEILGE